LNCLNIHIIDVDLLSTFSFEDLNYVIPLCFYLWRDRQADLGPDFYDFIANLINQNKRNNSVRQHIFWLSKIGIIERNEYTDKFNHVSNSQIHTLNFVEELTRNFNDISAGTSFKTMINDPLFSLPFKIQGVDVKKVFNSSARPKLIEFHYSKFVYEPCTAIFKIGDDLSVDMNVQTMFWVFNTIWSNAFSVDCPYIKLYRVMPTGPKSGFIEFLPSMSVESYDWDLVKIASTAERTRLMLSAAGSFVAVYVLGIRDRHRDNMLINDDYEYIHIDFGYMWNLKTWFDANRFAVPGELKDALSGQEWEFFMNQCVLAYTYLRRNIGLIMNLCLSLFDPLSHPNVIDCISKSFYYDQPEQTAGERIRTLISTGHASPKKYIKDLWHTRGNK